MLTIAGFGAYGNSGDNGSKEQLFRNKRCQKGTEIVRKSSNSSLEAGCREFESRHLDQKEKEGLCPPFLFETSKRLENQIQLSGGPLFAAGLDGGNSIIFISSGNENATESRHLDQKEKEGLCPPFLFETSKRPKT